MSGERAQTSVDFAIAMGVFLIAVTTVVAFLPEITGPFTGSQAQNPLLADRLASQIVEYQFGGEEAGVLDTLCAVNFFHDDPSSDCPSFEGEINDDYPNPQLGVDESVQVNVTVERVLANGSTEILCANVDSPRNVTDPPCSSGFEYRMQAGDPPPDDVASVSVARRMVYLDGRDNVLVVVRVWA